MTETEKIVPRIFEVFDGESYRVEIPPDIAEDMFVKYEAILSIVPRNMGISILNVVINKGEEYPAALKEELNKYRVKNG